MDTKEGNAQWAATQKQMMTEEELIEAKYAEYGDLSSTIQVLEQKKASEE
ncbi:MAG: hypothetical protein WCD86_21965 [Ktedonobacteraceae bacterium]